jgi:hypothetical protein
MKIPINLIRRAGKRILSPFRAHLRGQISDRSEIGRWITLLSSLTESKIIVEIGAWNGRGSSRMILKGARSKPRESTTVIGLEANPLSFKKAKRYLSRFPNYSLLWGSIVLPSELDHSELNADEVAWLQGDLIDLATAPYIFDSLPDSIDLLILDGGEFSTYGDYLKLQSRVKGWIILDDIYTRKCRRIMLDLAGQSDWIIVFESHERNGTAVLKRVL